MSPRVHNFSGAMENLRTASINSGRVSARTYHHINKAIAAKDQRIAELECRISWFESDAPARRIAELEARVQKLEAELVPVDWLMSYQGFLRDNPSPDNFERDTEVCKLLDLRRKNREADYEDDTTDELFYLLRQLGDI